MNGSLNILEKPNSCLALNTHAVCTGPCDAENIVKESSKNRVQKIRYPDSRWSWVVCFACFLINIILNGLTFSYGLLFPVLLEEFNEGKAKTAWLGSLALLSVGIYGPAVGKLCDRFGSRAVTIVGGLLCVVGTACTSEAPSLNIMFLTYGIIFGIGHSFVFISLYLIVPKYFVRRRSLAVGIINMGPAGGLFIMSPLVQILIENYTWRGTFLVIGITFLVICFLALTFDPNVAEVDSKEQVSSVVTSGSQSSKERTSDSLLQNHIFLIYTISATITYYGHYVTTVHMVRHCEDLGISARRASRLYLYSGLASLIMRPLVGRLCDVTKITPYRVFQVTTFINGVAGLLLPLATSYPYFVVYFVVYGLMDGSMGISIILSILASLSLAQRSFGFGVMQCVSCVAGISGPAVAGFLADQFGSYHPAFYMSGACQILAASITLLIYCIKKEDKTSQLEISLEQLIIVDKISVV